MVDFNTPLHNSEKFGVSHIQVDSRLDLVAFIDVHSLHGVDLQGASSTWTDKRVGDDSIQVHLDRTLISNNWLVKYV